MQTLPCKFYLKLIILVLTLSVTSTHAVEVIINAENYQQVTNFSDNDLKAIFSMRQRYWDNDEKIKVFVLPDNHATHKSFVKEKLHIFPHQLRKKWDLITYTGTGESPTMVFSLTEMLEKIQQNPNAIGYIDTKDTNNVNDSIYYLEL